ncbi:MAG: Gfo/Idh/MocA family oxidoreductase, partial [Omnitrophica bacterium]|nr:Gfo/Idh/MocA family oxidoreductase [Candidatus Omnitrophota bacterium]
MKEVRIALIGCGRISQEHLRAFAKIKNVKIQAVADNISEKAKSVAERYKCRAYTDYKDMIRSESLNAVVISAPPNEHVRMSVFALSRGHHVLCEKPFALNKTEAEKMCRSAKEKGLIL